PSNTFRWTGSGGGKLVCPRAARLSLQGRSRSGSCVVRGPSPARLPGRGTTATPPYPDGAHHPGRAAARSGSSAGGFGRPARSNGGRKGWEKTKKEKRRGAIYEAEPARRKPG